MKEKKQSTVSPKRSTSPIKLPKLSIPSSDTFIRDDNPAVAYEKSRQKTSVGTPRAFARSDFLRMLNEAESAEESELWGREAYYEKAQERFSQQLAEGEMLAASTLNKVSEEEEDDLWYSSEEETRSIKKTIDQASLRAEPRRPGHTEEQPEVGRYSPVECKKPLPEEKKVRRKKRATKKNLSRLANIWEERSQGSDASFFSPTAQHKTFR